MSSKTIHDKNFTQNNDNFFFYLKLMVANYKKKQALQIKPQKKLHYRPIQHTDGKGRRCSTFEA